MQIEQGANPSRVKAANQAAILKTIYHCGPIKRSEIARRLDLTLPTITTNINSMMARGIVRETGVAWQDDQMMGRKAHPVDIVPGSRHFIGIELQGMRRTACLLDYRGSALVTMEDSEDCQDYRRNIEPNPKNIFRYYHIKSKGQDCFSSSHNRKQTRMLQYA